ncbi:MAG TPA: efflux RND transporter periplasmic adaptor subunit [Motiliproteus sp.]
MAKARAILMPLGAVVGLLLMVAYMAGMFSEQIAPELAAPSPDVSSDRVAAEVITRPRLEAVPASVQAKQASVISARLLSTITAVKVRAGDTVRAGQLLVELDQRDLRARLLQSEEQVRASQARLQEAQSTLKRVEDLYTRKLVAQADLDRARSSFDSLTADLASAQQGVQEAQTALSHTRITAPIDGRIVDRFAEPGDTASPGVPLLSIYNPTTLRIEARVREKLALALRPDQPLEVRIPALEQTLQAELEELVPSADPGSRSFLVKARIAQDGRLLPGLYAELRVPAGEESLLLIPQDRVASVGQLNLVWVVTGAGVERRFVRLGTTMGERVQVLAGVSAGDELLLPRY